MKKLMFFFVFFLCENDYSFKRSYTYSGSNIFLNFFIELDCNVAVYNVNVLVIFFGLFRFAIKVSLSSFFVRALGFFKDLRSER